MDDGTEMVGSEVEGLRLFLFRQRRPKTLGEVAGELWSAVTALGALSPRWRTWQTYDYGDRARRVARAGDCERFLGEARIEWEGRPGARPTFRLEFLTKGTERERVVVSLVFAVDGDRTTGWRGLRVSARIGAAVREPPAVAFALAHEVFAAMVRAFRPDWAFLGTPSTPDRRWEQSFTPEAGWLTYLSTQASGAPFRGRFPYPRDVPPPALPAPATVDAVDDLGWIVAVAPELIRPEDAAQEAALCEVRRLLGACVRQEDPEPGRPSEEAAPLVGPPVGPSPWAAYAGSAEPADDAGPAGETDKTCEMRADAGRGPALPFSAGPMAGASLARREDARASRAGCGGTMELPVFPAEATPAFKMPTDVAPIWREPPVVAGGSALRFKPVPPTMVLPAFTDADARHEGALDNRAPGGEGASREVGTDRTMAIDRRLFRAALPFGAGPPPPAPAPEPSGPPGKRLVRFDTQTGEPLRVPLWVDVPEPVPSRSK